MTAFSMKAWWDVHNTLQNLWIYPYLRIVGSMEFLTLWILEPVIFKISDFQDIWILRYLDFRIFKSRDIWTAGPLISKIRSRTVLIPWISAIVQFVARRTGKLLFSSKSEREIYHSINEIILFWDFRP